MPAGDGIGQVWRWPLYSPRRFFSCVAVVLALIAVSNMALGGRGGTPQGQPTGTPSPTVQSTPDDSATPGDSSTTDAPALPAEPGITTPAITPTPSPKGALPGATQQASAIALAFTRAWADHVRPTAQWLAAVRRYADPEFAAQLGTVDPAKVPANKVIGQPRPVTVFYASAAFEVPTDTGVVTVDLVSDGRTWRVTDIHNRQ